MIFSKKRVAAAIVATAVCVCFFGSNLASFQAFNLSRYALSAPSDATIAHDGSLLIIDNSSRQLVEISADGKARFILKASSKGFSELADVLVDNESNIYVLDLQRAGGGRKISRERILKISADGKRQSVLLEIEHANVKFKKSVEQLLLIDGSLAYITSEADKFVLNKPGADGFTAKTAYPLADADLLLSSLAARGGDTVLFLTKKGELFETGENGDFSLLYDGPAQNAQSIPLDISVDGSGAVYFTDIGTREVIKLVDGQAVPVFTDDADFLEKSIYYKVDAANGVVFLNSESVALIGENGAESYSEFEVSGAILALRAALWLSLAIIAICAVYLAAAAIRAICAHKSFVVRLGASVLLGTVFATVIFSMIMSKNITYRITREMLNRLVTVSQLASQMIPAESFERADGVKDFLNEDYRLVHYALDRVFLANADHREDMYYVLYKVRGDVIYACYTLEDTIGIKYAYDWPYRNAPEQQVIEEQVTLTFSGITTAQGSFLFALSPIIGSDDQTVGIIEVGTDLYAFQQENNALILDLFLNIVSVAIIMVLLTIEVLLFASARAERASAGEYSSIPMGLTRMSVFLVFFITNINTSFLPVYTMRMVEQNGTVWGLSPEVMTAIPISTEVLFGAIFSLGGGAIIRVLGQRKSAIASSLLFMLGLAVKVSAFDFIALSAGSAINGCGWGILLLIVNVSIITEKDPAKKSSGFVGYTAATLSGINCGTVLGSFLLNWLSQRAVMWVAAALGALVLAFSACYIHNPRQAAALKKPPKSAMGAVRFFFSPKVFIFFMAVFIPKLACGYYLIYMFPIVGNALGIKETNIGYAFLLSNLIVICLGGVMTRQASGRLGIAASLAVSALLYSAAFALFAFNQTILMLLLSLGVMGFADSFGLSLLSGYFSELPQVGQLGYESAMGIISLIENFAQALGPFVFGFVLIAGIKPGLTVLSAALAAVTVLFVTANALWDSRNRSAALRPSNLGE